MVMRNKIRNTFTMFNVIQNPHVQQIEVKQIMRNFFVEKMFINDLINKGRLFYKHITLIRRKFKDKMETKGEKLNILKMYWDQTCLKYQKALQKDRNPELLKFVENTFKIKREVRDAALTEYLERCDKKHCIAFYQWRFKYPPKFEGTLSSKDKLVSSLV